MANICPVGPHEAKLVARGLCSRHYRETLARERGVPGWYGKPKPEPREPEWSRTAFLPRSKYRVRETLDGWEVYRDVRDRGAFT